MQPIWAPSIKVPHYSLVAPAAAEIPQHLAAGRQVADQRALPLFELIEKLEAKAFSKPISECAIIHGLPTGLLSLRVDHRQINPPLGMQGVTGTKYVRVDETFWGLYK